MRNPGVDSSEEKECNEEESLRSHFYSKIGEGEMQTGIIPGKWDRCSR